MQEIIEAGKFYIYKENRPVKVVQSDVKRQRAEIIEGEWNPFWVNYSSLKPLEDEKS